MQIPSILDKIIIYGNLLRIMSLILIGSPLIKSHIGLGSQTVSLITPNGIILINFHPRRW
ncbi:hypothetical protein EVA_11785 [gut metagenome]|uniref:Uncharacterized protein n=1 Tax=gut metagenome TaxID=749906 RepID=J9GKC7_9ZZZZ